MVSTDLRTLAQIPAPRLDVQRFELSSGAVLLVDRREGAPVAAIRVHFRGAHANDPPGREGTAELVGRFCDQGTTRHTEEELAELVEPEGGHLAGNASGVAGTISGSAWKLLVDVACELLLEADYPDEKIARQRQRLVDRLIVEREDHRIQAARHFRKLVYGDHWLGRPSHGTPESVAGIGRVELLAHRDEHWCPERAVIAVCGDVDPAAVKRAFERRLAGWKSGAELGPPDESFPDPAPRAAAFHADRQQVHVYLGHLGIPRSHPMYPALVVMDHVLGTGPGFTNRLSRKLRDEQGLAYSVHADIHSSAGLFPGTFSAYIGTSPENVERAVVSFLEEMRRIREEPVAAEELELAQSYLLGSYALGFERAARRVNYLVSAERFGLPPDHLERLPRELAAVTAEDVLRAARACLFPDTPCLAVGGPMGREEVDALLAKLLPGSGRASA